jgi:Fe-S cluster assembly iron-binding protein IscA
LPRTGDVRGRLTAGKRERVVNGITERAGERLKKVLDETGSPTEQAVRYRVTDGGGELTIDSTDPLDLAFEFGGRTVLIIDSVTAESVAGRKLDYDDGRFALI